MLVADASAVVAALLDLGPDGTWAAEQLTGSELAAPHLLPVEVASSLRQLSHRKVISADVASLAHADLQDLAVDLFPYSPFAARAWDLRQNLTPYDASYVALAEWLHADLLTLDLRLTRVKGLRCGFRTP